jgi:hypothetical protein
MKIKLRILRGIEPAQTKLSHLIRRAMPYATCYLPFQGADTQGDALRYILSALSGRRQALKGLKILA